jgi:membrane protein DedA with SNARE-associated domain
MIPAWYFAASWQLNIYLAIIMWISWSIVWAVFNYGIARLLGEKISKKLIWIKNHNICEKFFIKYWDITTFIWRLIPVVRQYISFPAWAFKMNFFKFILFTALGAGIWTSFLAILWYIIWDNIEIINQYKIYFFAWVFVLAGLIVWIKIKFMKKLKK